MPLRTTLYKLSLNKFEIYGIEIRVKFHARQTNIYPDIRVI